MGANAQSLGQKLMRNELATLKIADDPNIVRCLKQYHTDKNHYIVMEYVAGGSLKDLILDWQEKGGFTERAVFHFLSQLLLALNSIHSKNIVHRDLKPENLMVVE